MPENFFDFRKRMTPGRSKDRPEPAPAATEPSAASSASPAPLTVSALTALIDGALRQCLASTLHVRGEVSNLNPHRGSGHLYFTLKDARACIDCVMFKSDLERQKFMPEDGMELLAAGRVAVYPARGRYQLYVTRLHPLGQGALELAFRQLKDKLEQQGLFAPERKRPLPKYPLRIALVTSRQTAALQDMLKVLRRFPWLRLGLFHVPVQGAGSAEAIAAALKALGRSKWADLILLGRGGGSLEDLWEFNQEVVARAMAACATPVVTGIGHEVDVSIADLVADYHAHTPTEAAQVAVRHWREAPERLTQARRRLHRAAQGQWQEAGRRLAAIERHEVFRRPTDRIDRLRQLLDDRQRALQLALAERTRRWEACLRSLQQRLIEHHPRHVLNQRRQALAVLAQGMNRSMGELLRRRREQLISAEGQLRALSPQRVLARGYSITTRARDGKVLRSAAEAREGDRLSTRLADGTIESTVRDGRQLPLFE